MEDGEGRREEGGGRRCPGRGNLAQEPPSPEIIENRRSEQSGGGLVRGTPEEEIWPSSRRVPKSSKITDLTKSGGGLASGAPEKEILHRKSLI